MSLGDPPLSRSIGVALAGGDVQVYFSRGSPLPARRTFRHRAVETVVKGDAAHALSIPLVQGEHALAKLCRKVGALTIPGNDLRGTLAAGSEIELTLDVDRGGRLVARARVVALDQVFEEVARLLIPDPSPDALAEKLETARERIAGFVSSLARSGQTRGLARLREVQETLVPVEACIAAARGGDADAAQRADRLLLDADAALDELQLGARWPELEEHALEALHGATRAVEESGTAAERRLLELSTAAIHGAIEDRDEVELARQVRRVEDLHATAASRNPERVRSTFAWVASLADEATDLRAARDLVHKGRAAAAADDIDALRSITDRLFQLLPDRVTSRPAPEASGELPSGIR